ncbi:MAG: hypothetical protein HRT88_07440 [Lentisphaeraceae bacterium]|nr:hypothetical protein [Lentisphaeraceae bacterium]
MHWIPVRFTDLNHTLENIQVLGLRPIWQTRPSFFHVPKQVRITLRPPYFLSLPSDLAITRDALAIQIDFPLNGATSLSFKRTGIPALLGKPKKTRAETRAL